MPPSPRLHALVLLALAAASTACFPSCASGRSAQGSAAQAGGRPIRMRFVDYRSSQALALVDQSHTDRTELYSKKRALADAGTKVATDEILEETLGYFRGRGFFEMGRAGAAPATSEGVWSQSIEVETPEGVVHMSLSRSTPSAERQAFLECAKAFADVYNNTYQLQAVDRVPDWQAQKATQAPPKKEP